MSRLWLSPAVLALCAYPLGFAKLSPPREERDLQMSNLWEFGVLFFGLGFGAVGVSASVGIWINILNGSLSGPREGNQ